MNPNGYHGVTHDATEKRADGVADATRCDNPALTRRIPRVERVNPGLVYRIWLVRQVAESGLTGYGFGKKTGIAKGLVYTYLQGTRPTTLDQIFVVADKLGISTEDVFAELASIAARVEERVAVKLEEPPRGLANYQTAAEMAAEAMIAAAREATPLDESDDEDDGSPAPPAPRRGSPSHSPPPPHRR